MRTETDLPARALAITDQRPLSGVATTEAEPIAPLEEVTLPTDVLRAARLCTQKPMPYGGRPHLQGVYIHRTADGFVRIVGSDGSRLLVANVYREYADRRGAAWLEKGLIIPADELETRLQLLTKAGGRCIVSYAEGAPHVEMASPTGDVAFRLRPIIASYPDYTPIMSGWGGAFGDGERADFRPTAFDVKHLRQVNDVAKRLGVEAIDAYAAPFKPQGKQGVSSQPAVFTFGRGVALFVSTRATQGVVSMPDRALVAPAIKASLGALRAHETRHRKAAKRLTGKAREDEIARADDFKARIESLLQRGGDGSVSAALPAPVPPPPPPPPVINDAIDPDATPGSEGPTAEQIAAIETPAPAAETPVPAKAVKKAVVRRGARKPRKAKR